MPLEDDFSDIVKKARMGLGRSVETVAQSSGVKIDHLLTLERGSRTPTTDETHAIAKTLGLRSAALADIASGKWTPLSPPPQTTACVETILGSIGGYEVKGYIVHDSGEAILIDTAYNPAAMIRYLTANHLRLTAVCLTHGHSDHADGMEQLLDHHSAPVYLGAADESLLSWTPPRAHLNEPHHGGTISVGRLQIRFMTTPGHTPGGTCYRLTGGAVPMCFVGDTLFAGSIGRSNPSALYSTHLESVRAHVLALSSDTVLFPGHGPATTVHEEISHNPFVPSA
jgi:glyoxylase-like metal-dependent hydrolase (beta-lactamase superfamily II)